MEQWKDVEGYDGFYEVSNLGRIRSCFIGEYHIKKTNGVNSSGYQVVVFKKDGKFKNHTVHRLVALHFIPNPENKREVNHKNGIKTDNRVINLEWMTPKENQKHSVETGLKARGEANYNSKITEEQAREIKYGHQNLPHKEIALIYGITISRVSCIRTGRDWKHI